MAILHVFAPVEAAQVVSEFPNEGGGQLVLLILDQWPAELQHQELGFYLQIQIQIPLLVPEGQFSFTATPSIRVKVH